MSITTAIQLQLLHEVFNNHSVLTKPWMCVLVSADVSAN